MGLFDKVKDKLAGLTPDHTAALQERLGPEKLLAHVGVMPSATETDRSSEKVRNLTELAQRGAHQLTDKAIKDRHIGGGDGSLAHSLPRGTDPMMLALAEGSVTLWKITMSKGPELVARIERGEIASIADTGNRRARGHVRLSFTDESFFDYQTLSAPAEQFWQAAETFGTA